MSTDSLLMELMDDSSESLASMSMLMTSISASLDDGPAEDETAGVVLEPADGLTCGLSWLWRFFLFGWPALGATYVFLAGRGEILLLTLMTA